MNSAGGAAVVDDAASGSRAITGYTRHGLNQAVGRDGGRGGAPQAILEAVRSGEPAFQAATNTFKYVGDNAAIILNQEGRVVTAYARSGAGLRGGR